MASRQTLSPRPDGRNGVVKNYINTAVLYGVSGRWHLRGGGWQSYPPEPPAGLTERQQAIVAAHLAKGRARSRNPFEPIDPIRAAKLQAYRPPGNPRNEEARRATWLRQREKPSG